MPSFLRCSFINLGRIALLLATLQLAACNSPEDRAQTYYQRGMKLVAQQDYVKASLEFRNALQLKKDLIEAWRALADIEQRNQNWEGLIAIRRTIVELDPKDVDEKLRLARLLVVGKMPEDALNLVNAAVELDEQNSNAQGLKSLILFKLDDYRGAVREAQAALRKDPNNVEATVVIAAEKFARGDADGALAVLNRENAPYMNDIGVQLFRLKIFEQMRDSKQVEAALRKLIELYPTEIPFRRALVKHYIDQQRPADAEKELQILAAANPSDLEAGLDVVRYLGMTKGAAAARQELVARSSSGPEAFRYRVALAEFDFGQGNVEESIRALENLGSGAESRELGLEAQTKLAEIYFRTKKLEAASALIDEILRKDNRNAVGLRLRASLRMEQGQYDAAIADARQALNDQPRSTELSLLLAKAYERSGSIELAEKQYADATKSSGYDIATSLEYTDFLRRRGSVGRAEDVLNELASRWPSNVGILVALANVRLEQKNWVGAQDIAEKIRRVSGNTGLADQISGVALGARNKNDESITALQKAYAAAPGNAQAMDTLVNAYIRAGKLDEAKSFLRAVLDVNTASAEAQVLLGSIELLQNAPERAAQSFRIAIERQPKNPVGYRALAELHQRQGNSDAALDVIQAALKEQPDNFEMRLALASALEAKGDYEAAIAEYEYMLKQNSGSLLVANNLASLLADHHTDKASLDRAYSLATILRKSQVPLFKDTLGWTYYQRGDYKNAISLLEEAVLALPQMALVRYHLGMTLLADGQAAKALEQFKKALELAPPSDLHAKIRTAQEKGAM